MPASLLLTYGKVWASYPVVNLALLVVNTVSNSHITDENLSAVTQALMLTDVLMLLKFYPSYIWCHSWMFFLHGQISVGLKIVGNIWDNVSSPIKKRTFGILDILMHILNCIKIKRVFFLSQRALILNKTAAMKY